MHRRRFHGRAAVAAWFWLDVGVRVRRASLTSGPARVIARSEGGREGGVPDDWAVGSGVRDALLGELAVSLRAAGYADLASGQFDGGYFL